MSDGSHGRMLPPIAILRERDWGKDVTAIARGDWDRVSDLDTVGVLREEANTGTIAAVVHLHRYRRAIGDIAKRSYFQRISLNADQARAIIRNASSEVDIAHAMELFVENGSKIVVVGPEHLAEMAADATCDLTAGGIGFEPFSFYVHFEGDVGRGMNEGDLDGFAINYDFSSGTPVLHVTPLNRTPAPVDAVGSSETMLKLSLEDDDTTISQAIADRIDELLKTLELRASASKTTDVDDDVPTPPASENVLRQAVRDTLDDHTDATLSFLALVSDHVERWSRLVGGAIRCVKGDGPIGVAGFAPGAPAELLEKALGGGTGARKVQQRLSAMGYPSVVRYETGNVVPEAPAPEICQENATAKQAMEPVADIGSETPETPKIDRRKLRRLQKQAPREMPASPVAVPAETASDQPPSLPTENVGNGADEPLRKASRKKIGEEERGPARHDAELLVDLKDTLYRSFKDMPVVGSRNWESSFPPALASMIIRRSSVPRLPRETSDTTRKRLAGDIMPRFEGLPDLIRRLKVESEANPDRRRAMAVGASSVMRDLDMDVAEDLAHPLLVSVSQDDRLQRLLRFVGVEPGRDAKATTIVLAWREARILHLIGYVYDGCLIGFRRVEVNLDDGEIATFDAEGDLSQPEDLVDALYAPVADAMLGPVDESEAWRYARRASRRQRRTASVPATPEIRQVPASPPPAEWTPHPVDFESWEGVSRPVDPLTPSMRMQVDAIMSRNAVTRAAMHALDADTLQGDEDRTKVRRAFTRHLASLAKSGGRIDSLTSPDIDEDVDLTPANDADGVLVVSDRALFDHASPGLVSGRMGTRDTSICIFYRVRRNAVAALVVQPTADGHINLAQWTTLPIRATTDEDDLSWYVRGAIAHVLLERPKASTPEPDILALPAAAPAQSAFPAHVSSVRQGPRRIVAQARIMPANLRTAVSIAQAWFDEQAVRHGDRLIEDRRDAGQWLIEHESDDRGIRSRWSVTLRLAETSPAALDIVVRTTLAAGVRPRLPTLIREIASAVPTTGPDGLLTPMPPLVRTRSDLNELLRHLHSPDRILPTLLVSMSQDGEIAFSPQDLAAQSMGAMNVRIIHNDMTYDLAEVLGQEYRTFGGAMRLFQPRFDPDTDNPSRHPRLMNDTQGRRSVSDLITRATAQTITRYDIPDTLDVPQQATPAAPSPARSATTPNHQTVRQTPVPRSTVDSVEIARRDADEAARREAARREREEERERQAAEPPLPFAEDVGVPEESTSAEECAEKEEAPSVDPAVQAFLAPIVPEAPAEPESGRSEQQAIAAPSEPAPVDLDEIARRVASLIAPPPVAGSAGASDRSLVEQPEALATEPHATVDLDAAMERRIEMAVASRFSSLGLGDLVNAVTGLIGKVDGMMSARLAVPAAVAAPMASSDQQAEIERLREQMKSERDSGMELITEADAQRNAALAEVAVLRRALNEQRRQAYAGTVRDAWPSDISKLADWLERNVLPNVVVTAKAYREMRKVRYTDMERLCRTLQLLDGPYVDMRAGEEGAKERWDEGLKELRLQQKKQTQMGKKGIRGGNEYSFEHEGIRWDMDYHIRGIESVHNEHDRLLRIYYAYDKDEGRVLIGHMPTHLTTIDS